MERIVSNPGLQHLAEKVFWNLDVEDLKICAQINQSCKHILQNPIFCLRKFQYLSKKNKEGWINVIQSVKHSDKGIAIISYLQWNLKKKVMDPPCYSTPAVQGDFLKKIWEKCRKKKLSNEEIRIVKILAPLMYNPNPPIPTHGYTPLHWASGNGNVEIVKILAPLIDNPNAPMDDVDIPDLGMWGGMTTIYLAAFKGHTEIVKILASLTENPNAPNGNGFRYTPIMIAAIIGYTEIVKILAPLTKNPNAPCYNGTTPILEAAHRGHTEIVKILAPLTANPNAPNNDGETPSSVAKNDEIRQILDPSTLKT